MELEYLIVDSETKRKLEKYRPQGVSKKLYAIKNHNAFCLRLSVKGENKKAARTLSGVDEYIQHNYHLTTLKNEASQYFNKKLFPLVTGFENKLRKLLYLSSAIAKNEDAAKNIVKLEEKTFGELFTLLFFDVMFMDKIKNEIKNRKREAFFKAEILSMIETTEEKPLWDDLLDKDVVPTLRKRFIEVKDYRNDVMHSHYIGWNRFNTIRKLFEVINGELDTAIKNIDIKIIEDTVKPSFNKTLKSALTAQEQIDRMMRSVQPIIDRVQPMAELFPNPSAYAETLKSFQAISPQVFEAFRDKYPYLSKPEAINKWYEEQHRALTKTEESLRSLDFGGVQNGFSGLNTIEGDQAIQDSAEDPQSDSDGRGDNG